MYVFDIVFLICSIIHVVFWKYRPLILKTGEKSHKQNWTYDTIVYFNWRTHHIKEHQTGQSRIVITKQCVNQWDKKVSVGIKIRSHIY